MTASSQTPRGVSASVCDAPWGGAGTGVGVEVWVRRGCALVVASVGLLNSCRNTERRARAVVWLAFSSGSRCHWRRMPRLLLRWHGGRCWWRAGRRSPCCCRWSCWCTVPSVASAARVRKVRGSVATRLGERTLPGGTERREERSSKWRLASGHRAAEGHPAFTRRRCATAWRRTRTVRPSWSMTTARPTAWGTVADRQALANLPPRLWTSVSHGRPCPRSRLPRVRDRGVSAC